MPNFKIEKSFLAENGRIVFTLNNQSFMVSISAGLALRFLRDFIGKKMFRVDAKLFTGSKITAEKAEVLKAGTKWNNTDTGESGILESDRLELENWKLILNEDKVVDKLSKYAKIRKQSGKVEISEEVTVKTETTKEKEKETKGSKVKEDELP